MSRDPDARLVQLANGQAWARDANGDWHEIDLPPGTGTPSFARPRTLTALRQFFARHRKDQDPADPPYGKCVFCGHTGLVKMHHGWDPVCVDDDACLARGWQGMDSYGR